MRWSGLPPGALHGPLRRYTKDAEMGKRAQGVVGYVTWCNRENKHGVEPSTSSHSYDRNESGVRVDRGTDRREHA